MCEVCILLFINREQDVVSIKEQVPKVIQEGTIIPLRLVLILVVRILPIRMLQWVLFCFDF